MIISELKLYDFRRFHSIGDAPGLELRFHEGLNALVGENDSGKTAIIDAIKLVLFTQSGEYIHPTVDDFYTDGKGSRAKEFRIECVIANLSSNEAKNFIEYLTIDCDGSIPSFTIHLFYRAWREGSRVFSELMVGDRDEGNRLAGRARELLKVVYLKPLRDAERELSAGRRSRLSQILASHPAFIDDESHPLITVFGDANRSIDEYFKTDAMGKEILGTIRGNLSAFHDSDEYNDASMRASEVSLKSILESLSLSIDGPGAGLGELNLLFIAAELLLLSNSVDGGMRTALIEELEAHLHPQAQLRLIDFLQGEYNEHGAQIIISTHSPVLASKINLKNLIIMKGGFGYDLAEGQTKLQKGDYLFLQRFLDATKANLFFAKGIIMVEGDAENLLIPALADIIGCPLEKYGVSVVNVHGTAFLRYSRIMARSDGTSMGIPVSVVTDCDVSPTESESDTKVVRFRDKTEESKRAVTDKTDKYTEGNVHAFVSPRWTLEYCLALSCLGEKFHRAINLGKKVKNSDGQPLSAEKIKQADEQTEKELQEFRNYSDGERAYKVYSLMLRNDGSSGLKAIVAQSLASVLRWETSVIPSDITQERMFDLDLYRLKPDSIKRDVFRKRIEEDEYLSYLVDAIRYACGLPEIERVAHA